jgi:hypothetical protein
VPYFTTLLVPLTVEQLWKARPATENARLGGNLNQNLDTKKQFSLIWLPLISVHPTKIGKYQLVMIFLSLQKFLIRR